MNDKNSNWEIFNQSIQSKMCDDQWDNLMVQKIMFARKEYNRKWMQFAIIPCLLITTTSIFYLSGAYDNRTQKITKDLNQKINNPAPSKRATSVQENNDFKLHIIDVVFNKLQ